ncbi:MAG: hypothetical protein E7282_10965 [Lachnospiraceae bacterium]|nr:hypothetical protein [Lachnospiraceae bacterium]
MEKEYKDNALVREEQEILDDLVDRMNEVIEHLEDKAKVFVEEAKEARNAGIHDNYYAFLLAKNGLKDTEENRKKLQQAKDELYDQRVEVYIDNDKEPTSIQIGDSSFNYKEINYVTSRNRPICRAFWGGQMPEEFEFDNIDEHGKYVAHVKCKLKLGRNIDLHFSKVRDVLNVFPLTEEEQDELIIDILTQELLERRSDNEWKSILKSIQKKQKEIVLSPLEENLIVQGCAGSGKTMIMLHRLPIVLMDNPNVLRKNSIYVITPSKTYIQLAQDLIRKYEIADISMGVINDYYNYCISKYGHKPEEYGEINPSITLSEQDTAFVYSTEALNLIEQFYENEIEKYEIDLSFECGVLGLKEENVNAESYAKRIHNLLMLFGKVTLENEKILEECYGNIKNAIKNYQSFASSLENRKSSIVRDLRQHISKEEADILKAKKELEKLNEDDNKIAWSNRQKIISAAITEIEKYQMIMDRVERDNEYFVLFAPIIEYVEKMTLLFENIESQESNPTHAAYALIKIFDSMKKIEEDIERDFFRIEEKYIEYGNNPLSRYQSAKQQFSRMLNIEREFLPINRYMEIKNLYAGINDSSQSIVKNAYYEVLHKLNCRKDETDALSCSPYIYLQALYIYSGIPNGEKESLITIDEVQGIAPEEINLIKKINGDRLVLNLFGDIRQHIEGTKGFDDWNELNSIISYKKYEMEENYRNAKEIAEYCNGHFEGMNMRPMNTAGKGVHELHDREQFVEKMEQNFLDVNRTGLAAIIVKNDYEADYLKDIFSSFENKLFDMTGEEFSPHRTRWNIITVEDAKGLEFNTVAVLDGRMTPNEKYIAYTRALNELFVLDEIIDISKYMKIRAEEEKKRKEKLNKSKKDLKQSGQGEIKSSAAHINNRVDKQTQSTKDKFANSEVRRFFESKGLEVVDNRMKKGHLWVIGDTPEIRAAVNEAVQRFKITGTYKASKETKSRKGWGTKTKK